MEGLWLRFRSYSLVRPTRDEETLSVLVGVQPRHFAVLGVKAQSLLSGDGITDSHLTQGDIDKSNWTFDEAVLHCCKQMTNFQLSRGASAISRRQEAIIEAFEASDFVHLGQPCVAPNGRVSQELTMGVKTLLPLIEEARSDVWPFLLLREIGRRCIEVGNLDVQPRAFTDFLGAILEGSIVAPAKIPKQLIYKTRDALIRALVKGLVLHGLPATRNDMSPPYSACDAVAQAAILSKLESPRSYETVKALYSARLG